MITVKQSREKDEKRFEQETLKFSDSLEAIVHLAEAEIGWGGQITEIGVNRISVQTSSPYGLDTAVFSGPVDEMKPLLKFISCYQEMGQKHSGFIMDQSAEFLKELFKDNGGAAIFLSMAAPLVIVNKRLKAAMTACGIVASAPHSR